MQTDTVIGQWRLARNLLGNRRQAAHFRRADPHHPPGKRSGKNPRTVWPGEWGPCRVLRYGRGPELMLKKRGVRCVRQGNKLVVDKQAYEAAIRKAAASEPVGEMIQDLMKEG